MNCGVEEEKNRGKINRKGIERKKGRRRKKGMEKKGVFYNIEKEEKIKVKKRNEIKRNEEGIKVK